MDKDFFFKVLFEAIEGGNNVSINRSSDKEALFHFASRFLIYDEDREEIMIDIPLSEERESLRINDKIEVFFVSKNLRLGFFSKVVGFSEFKLSSDNIIPSLVISKPDEGLDLQRRQDFRVPTPPLKVEIKYIKEEEEKKDKIIETTCLCEDLSRSGIALTEDKQIKDRLRLDKGIFLNMTIYFEEVNIHMEGKVESKRELYEGKKTVFGVDFAKNKPDKLIYKKNIATIMKYIMKRQREIMYKV